MKDIESRLFYQAEKPPAVGVTVMQIMLEALQQWLVEIDPQELHIFGTRMFKTARPTLDQLFPGDNLQSDQEKNEFIFYHQLEFVACMLEHTHMSGEEIDALLLQTSLHKAGKGFVGYSILSRLAEVAVVQLQNYIRKAVQASGGAHHPQLKLLQEELDVHFDQFRKIPITLETCEVFGLLQEVTEYFERVLHNRYNRKIRLHILNQLSESSQHVRIHRVGFIQALKNLVGDVIVHASSSEEEVSVDIVVSPGPTNRVVLVQISNTVELLPDECEQLIENLGKRRVVLTDMGTVELVPETDVTTFGYHGNGKLSVRRTTETMMRQAGVAQEEITAYLLDHWTAEKLYQIPEEPAAHMPLGAQSRNMYLLTCTVPLVVA